MRFKAFLGFILTLFFVSSVSAKITPFADEDALKKQLVVAVTQGHHAVGYSRARIDLLGSMALSQVNNQYVVTDVYCEQKYPSPGPGRIPNNSVINVEHTWPQSKFGGASKGDQKSDLHHLYPADSQLNGIRGNYPFGVVEKPLMVTKCPISQIGNDASGQRVFEPPANHRGNVARAIFYFSIRYGLKVDAKQEAVLKQWNMEDPPDAAELKRNDDVEGFQGNRNPFIDEPDLVNAISDF
jgi:deoxyribonuclease I